MNKKRIQILAPVSLGILTLLLLAPMTFRPIWFDEALTIVDFVMLDNYVDIYFNYSIPNNHIVYSIFLKAFLVIVPMTEFSLRAGSLLLALTSVLFAFACWKRKFGVVPTYITLLSLIFSGSFSIYGTAIRGYMLSFLLILLALHSALAFLRKKDRKYLFLYAISVFLALGTIPSNIAGIFGVFIVLFFESRGKLGKLTRFPENLLLALPFLAIALFYLPIFGNFIKAMGLKEGWNEALHASLHFYAAILISFLPLIACAAIGIFLNRKKINKAMVLALALIFMLPGLIFIIKTPSPFPRTFFPYLAVLLYILAYFTMHAYAFARLRFKAPGRRLAVMITTCIIVLSGLLQFNCRNAFSNAFTISGQDDFFEPYFLRQDFQPYRAARKTAQIINPGNNKIFVDKRTDYPAFIFYANAIGIPSENILFDHPYRNLDSLGNITLIFIATQNDDSMKTLSERFKLFDTKLIEDFGQYKLYSAQKKNE